MATVHEGEGLIPEIPASKINHKYDPMPEGKYTLVAVDVDTTGKRLIDEIVQVATFSPEKSFSQYIMPLMNLNPAARQRHQVRVITVGFFRMLKSMQNYKVMKTKTEVAALNEFLKHLEGIKASDEGSTGIILVFHEQRKFVPYMIIEAMKKYNFLERFLNTVKSFVNTHPIAVERCGNSMKYFSLRQTHKVLINPNNNIVNDKEAVVEGAASKEAQTEAEIEAEKDAQAEARNALIPPSNQYIQDMDSFEGNAAVRAQLVFDIGKQLARGTENIDDLTPEQLNDKFMQLVKCYAHSIDHEIEELKEQERILARQSSLRPIFLQYFRTTLHHRVKAVTFRRVLAELNFDLEKLQALWNDEKREGLITALEKTEELKPEDREELVDILDHHFDPEKQSVRPRVTRRRSTSRRRRNRQLPNDEQNNNRGKNNKENVAQENARGDGATKKKRQNKSSPRRNFRRVRVNRGLATAN